MWVEQRLDDAPIVWFSGVFNTVYNCFQATKQYRWTGGRTTPIQSAGRECQTKARNHCGENGPAHRGKKVADSDSARGNDNNAQLRTTKANSKETQITKLMRDHQIIRLVDA